MRKLISYLFMSLDGVVEAPDRYVRDDVYQHLPPLIGETIAEQDAVLLGHKIYEESSEYWRQSRIEPFATFINNTPRYIVSRTLTVLGWHRSTLIVRRSSRGNRRPQEPAWKGDRSPWKHQPRAVIVAGRPA